MNGFEKFITQRKPDTSEKTTRKEPEQEQEPGIITEVPGGRRQKAVSEIEARYREYMGRYGDEVVGTMTALSAIMDRRGSSLFKEGRFPRI